VKDLKFLSFEQWLELNTEILKQEFCEECEEIDSSCPDDVSCEDLSCPIIKGHYEGQKELDRFNWGKYLNA